MTAPTHPAGQDDALRKVVPHGVRGAKEVLASYAALPEAQRALVTQLAEIVWPFMDRAEKAEAEIASLHADKDRLARDLAAAREESSRWEAATRLLLPFVDAAAGEELEIARTEHGPRLESLAICCAVADALGITVESAEYEALALAPGGDRAD